MDKIPVSEGILSHYLEVNGYKIHYLARGNPDALQKVMMVHGNVAAATWWEEQMLALDPTVYHCVAIDLRGYGDSDAAPVNATRGLRDLMDDVDALVRHLGWEKHHYWGHSMGTGVGYHYIVDHGERVASAIFAGAMSPYGFGGTKDIAGNPSTPDFAGSGGLLFNQELLRMIKEGYRSDAHPLSPLNALRNTIFKPSFRHPREEVILTALVSTAVSDDNLSGNYTGSPHWPMFAPGDRGISNAFSPKYFNGSDIVNAPHKPPILWVRGADDVIISNTSLSDIATHGKAGLVPGYPGEDIFPQQPMIEQVRDVLDRYQANGGRYTEHIFADCGHSPQVEKFDDFMPLAIAFTQQHAI